MPVPMPPKNKKEFSWGRFSKTLSFWILILLIPVVLIQFPGAKAEASKHDHVHAVSGRARPRQHPESDDHRRQDRQRQVQAARSNMRRRRTSKNFTVALPVENSELEVDALNAQGRRDRREGRRRLDHGVDAQLPAVAAADRLLSVPVQADAGGRREGVLVRQVEGEAAHGRHAEGHVRRRRRRDEAKQELQEIIEFLRDPQKFTKLGGRLPKGALLVGPPGTGKTLLAKAVAGEAGRPFFSMSGSDFVEMFVGVGASRVRDLFEQGKAHAPCIIFIDEIDAVGRHRGAGLGGGHDEREQTLNQLLVEMDGFESNDGVILIAATNRPDVLDPALLRPGRFDRQIVVDAPDLRGREGILRVHLRNKPIADDVDITTLARGTPGMAGADLANLVNEGALLAARRNHDKIYMADLEDAKDKVMLGAERKSMVMKEEERRLTAYHEAGHAICAMRVKGNDPLHKVTIVPRGRALGSGVHAAGRRPRVVTRQQLEARLVMAYGGRAAEELVFGRDRVTTGAASDIQKATAIARRYVTQWGLSDAIGPILVGDNEQELFLGREIQHRREVSEQTAQLVDAEVKRVIDRCVPAREGDAAGEHRAAAPGRRGAARARDADARGHRDPVARRHVAAAASGAGPRRRRRRRRRCSSRGAQSAVAWRTGAEPGVE